MFRVIPILLIALLVSGCTVPNSNQEVRSWRVTLYGNDGKEIRAWIACDNGENKFHPQADGSSIVFWDSSTGVSVVVSGTVTVCEYVKVEQNAN